MDVLELADGEAVEVSPDSSNNAGCTLDLDVGMVSNPVQDTRQENKAHPKDPVSMTQTRTDEVRTPTTTKSTGLVFKVKSTILGQSNPWSNSQVLHSLQYHSFLVTAMLPRCGGKHHLDELVVVSVVYQEMGPIGNKTRMSCAALRAAPISAISRGVIIAEPAEVCSVVTAVRRSSHWSCTLIHNACVTPVTRGLMKSR